MGIVVRRRWNRLLLALTLGGLSLACACHAYDLGSAPTKDTPIADTARPTWEEIRTVMYDKCDTCHGSTDPRVPANARDLQFYLSQESNFLERLERIEQRVYGSPDNPMPPKFGSPLSADEYVALNNYIQTKKEAR